MSWPNHRLLDLLGIDHPIIQAPMAGASTPALAAAVSNAGALGGFGGTDSRPAISGSIVRDGRDGSLSAGVYYLAIGVFNVTFNPAVEWGAVSNYNGPVDTIPVSILTGVAVCRADIGAQGGLPGRDGHLDNNDFLVFISYFFNQNGLADMGVQGGTVGSDGHFDNNDFIAFISLFFGGCS